MERREVLYRKHSRRTSIPMPADAGAIWLRPVPVALASAR